MTAAAQDTATQQPLWQMRETVGDWSIMCATSSPDTCRMVQVRTSNEGQKGRLLEVNLGKHGENALMIMTLPFGLDLRVGGVMKVDNKPEVKFDYSTCTPEGCQAILPVDADMMKTLQNGSEMSVGFRPWGNDQTLVVKASLKGSAAAMTKLGLR